MSDLDFNSIPSNSSIGYLDDEYPVDRRSCQLLGPTALIVQGLMGILVILSLVYKRHREKPVRPWKIWLFDVSKQIVGQMFVHGVNVFISDLVSHLSSSNACVSYFLNILIDTTLGVALIYLILHVLTFFCSEKLQLKGFESGVYGTPPSFQYWIRQAFLYVVALTTMKFLVIGLLALFPGLFQIAEWLLSWTWTGEGDAVQVIFVMGIFPIIMNILQFWLIDSIVKASESQVALETDSHLDHADREPLFGVPSDDEDDEHDTSTQQRDLESQRRRSRSADHRSRSFDKDSNTTSDNPYEPKSSGSNTPGTVNDVANAYNSEIHSYPPSLSSSLTSTASSSSSGPPSIIREATKLNKKRRGPPTPLNIQPLRQPAINSPQPQPQDPHQSTPPRQPSPKLAKPVIVKAPAVVDASGNDWADNWDDADDWAHRVGEEEWTGRRLEQTKDNLHDVWEREGSKAVAAS